MSISDFAATPEKEPEETKWDNGTDTKTPGITATVSNAESTTTTTQAVVTEIPTSNQTNPDEILNNLMGMVKPVGQKSHFKMMIYGDPGTMKSSFVATAPNNFIFDLEDGLISAKGSPNGVADNVQSFPWKDFDAFGTFIGYFMNDAEQLKSFDVMSIDSLSELHKRALAEVTEREWRKRPSSNRYVAETEHHVENNERIMRVIRALRDVQRDLIITAHAKTIVNKDKSSKTYADFSESLSNRIMGMMDIVGYMFVKEIDGKPTPVMRVSTEGTIQCKSRIPLPVEILNPTWPQLKAAWEASKNQ